MKYLINQSVRVAFHYCMDAFIMGEFDVPENHDEIMVNFVLNHIVIARS